MDRRLRLSMPFPLVGHLRRVLCHASLIAASCLLGLGSNLCAAEPATQPATDSAHRLPGLEQLNTECVSLYDRMQGSVLRVQMPTPRWASNSTLRDNGRWDNYKLNPEVKRALVQPPSRNGYNSPGQNSGNAGNTGNGLNNDTSNSGNSTNTLPAPATLSTQPAAQSAPGSGNRGQNAGGPMGNGAPIGGPTNNFNQLNTQNQQRSAQVEVNPPATAPGAATENNRPQAKEYTYVVPTQQLNGNNDLSPQQLAVGNRAFANTARTNEMFFPNCVGLLFDDKGHVLVPMYIEREAVGEQTIKLAIGDGDPIDAAFVGSDEQTQLTVLRLATNGKVANAKVPSRENKAATTDNKPSEEQAQVNSQNTRMARAATGPASNPVHLSRKKLPEGSVILLLSTTDGAGRLSVWNGGTKESGVVVTIDGQVAGIARGGQFLSGAACRLIADQIVAHGSVRRATLGVIVTQVDAVDLGRPQIADFPADRSVLRVDQVMKGSVAEHGGMRVGDLIISVADESVSDIPGLAALVAARQGPTKVTVLRDNKPVVLEVLLVQQ